MWQEKSRGDQIWLAVHNHLQHLLPKLEPKLNYPLPFVEESFWANLQAKVVCSECRERSDAPHLQAEWQCTSTPSMLSRWRRPVGCIAHKVCTVHPFRFLNTADHVTVVFRGCSQPAHEVLLSSEKIQNGWSRFEDYMGSFDQGRYFLKSPPSEPGVWIPHPTFLF